MPYCLPIVTITNDFGLAFWKVFWYPSICATHENTQRYFVLFFPSWPFSFFFCWQYPRCKLRTSLFPFLLWNTPWSSFFLRREQPCWVRSNLPVTQARQENGACRSNPSHAILSLPTVHPTFFLWMSDDSLIYYRLFFFFLSRWQSICSKPHCILFICRSVVTILKKQTKWQIIDN